MNKKFFLIFSVLIVFLVFPVSLNANEFDEWKDSLDVYNSDGLDRPVSAVEYQKVMKELEELKAKKQKKKKFFWQKEEPTPVQKETDNKPIEPERNDIIKITTPLYYDGKILQIGFYKVACTEENNNYYINFLQGKTPILKVKANKVSHMDFCPDKVNCVEAETYQDKYYKINFKTIDYAVRAYLTLLK